MSFQQSTECVTSQILWHNVPPLSLSLWNGQGMAENGWTSNKCEDYMYDSEDFPCCSIFFGFLVSRDLICSYSAILYGNVVHIFRCSLCNVVSVRTGNAYYIHFVTDKIPKTWKVKFFVEWKKLTLLLVIPLN